MSSSVIIQNYVNVIGEYIELICESKHMNETNTPMSIMYIGFNSLHRVFEYLIIKTKNLEKACQYSKKTFYYYLEYMEQIHRSNLGQSLNHMDAVMFVYRKTIFDLYDGESEDSYNTMTNIITYNQDNVINDEPDIGLFPKLSKFVNTFFYWENPNITIFERKELFNLYLLRFLKQISALEKINRLLDFIQKNENFTFAMYSDLLKELLEHVEKKKRPIVQDDNSEYILKALIERDIFFEKLRGGNIKDFVTWINM
jgi:hypothetical protein